MGIMPDAQQVQRDEHAVSLAASYAGSDSSSPTTITATMTHDGLNGALDEVQRLRTSKLIAYHLKNHLVDPAALTFAARYEAAVLALRSCDFVEAAALLTAEITGDAQQQQQQQQFSQQQQHHATHGTDFMTPMGLDEEDAVVMHAGSPTLLSGNDAGTAVGVTTPTPTSPLVNGGSGVPQPSAGPPGLVVTGASVSDRTAPPGLVDAVVVSAPNVTVSAIGVETPANHLLSGSHHNSQNGNNNGNTNTNNNRHRSLSVNSRATSNGGPTMAAIAAAEETAQRMWIPGASSRAFDGRKSVVTLLGIAQRMADYPQVNAEDLHNGEFFYRADAK
jgi:hypothetical protein